MENLWEVFNRGLFRIPDYQRGYAWQKGKSGQKSQLGEFWDDLINLDINREHYTGLLTLNRLSADSNPKVYEVVDGQQRLTTAVILIKVLLERFEENKDHFEGKLGIFLEDIKKHFIRRKKPGGDYVYIFGYDKDDPSYSCLRYKIFGEKKTPDMGAAPDTYYTKNLEAAKKFFAEKVKELKNNDDKVVEIYKKLVNKLIFNVHEIGSNFDVFVSFETMNNRGKPLSNLELLKDRLIYLSVLFNDANLRSDITEAWKEIYKRLAQNSDELIDDDEFLRAHWITYFGAPQKKQREDISFLMEHFSPRNIKGFITAQPSTDKSITAADVRAYVESLKNFAKFYVFTYFPNLPDSANNLSAEEKIQIFFLNQLGLRYFRPLLMVACSKNFSAARLKFFKAVERFIFVMFELGSRRSDKSQTVYYNAAGELNRGETTFAALTAQLNDEVEDAKESACKTFENEIDDNFRRAEGFYTWGDSLRYFLLVYEYELRRENNSNKTPFTFDTIKKFAEECKEIEHIFPQTPTDYWDNVFTGVDDKQKHCLRHALGNLLRLSKTDNIAASNKNFDDKKPIYEKSSQSAWKVAQEFRWTRAEIYARSEKLLGFMDSHWGLGLSAAQKKSLIHL